MAAQLQIFMTNPASHTHCKGMWNLCVNLAVVVVVVVKKKNNLFRGVSTLLRRRYVRFDKESHGSSIHPDLNMSEFSRLAIGKSFLGKVVRFFYSLTLRRMGRRAPFYEGYLFFSLGRDLQKTITNFTPLSELPGICGEDVCLFVESESFDTGGPNTCPTAIEHFLKKGENTFQPSAFCHFLTL